MRFRLALGFAVVLAACSGGGSNGPSVPSLPWGEFRHDDSNAGVGGFLNDNSGNVTLLKEASFPLSTGAMATASTPTIDHNNNIILGTSQGIVAFGSDGTLLWTFEGFMASPVTPNETPNACATCSPGTAGCLPVGSVSASPTVSPGNAVVFGNDGNPSYLFAIQERPDTPDCLWAAPIPKGTRSSAITQIYTLDLSLQTIYAAADDGILRALNSDGSIRWFVSPGAGPITSTPALDTTGNIYVTTPDGMLRAYDSGGRPLTSGFPFSTGVPPVTTPPSPYQPSPGVGPSAYVIGADGTLFQGRPQGWQFSANNPPIIGSPAFLTQSISFMATSVTDTIVYTVDTDGTAYGVRNQTGEVLKAQRCSEDVDLECRTDSCNPTGAIPPVDTCSPSTPHRCEMTGLTCTEDTCVVNDHGTCVVSKGPVSFATEPAETVSITGSPIASSDPFVVVGTADGKVCARSLANLVPGQNLSSPPRAWRGGYCSTTTVQTCVEDSDCPKDETCSPPSSCTANGCGTPGGHCSITTAQTCVTDSDCPQNQPHPETCVAAGPHCSVTTMLSCAVQNNCPTDEYCVYVGCVPLTDNGIPDGGPVTSSAILGIDSTIYVTTAKGLYVIK